MGFEVSQNAWRFWRLLHGHLKEASILLCSFRRPQSEHLCIYSMGIYKVQAGNIGGSPEQPRPLRASL